MDNFCMNCLHYENESYPCQWDYLFADEEESFNCCDWVNKNDIEKNTQYNNQEIRRTHDMTTRKETYEYDKDTHTTYCTRKIKGKIYRGQAKCHPQDYDFENHRTGEYYAFMRSGIEQLCCDRESIKSALKALKHLYDILDQNKAVNKKSIECYMIRRQIKIKEKELKVIRGIISATKTSLRSTIAQKDRLYNAIREKRAADNA